MTTAAHRETPFLQWLSQPLRWQELSIVGAAGVLAMLSYCLLHELVRGFSFAPAPSLWWAIAGVLPLMVAYESLKRVPDKYFMAPVPLAGLFIFSSLATIVLSTMLTLPVGMIFAAGSEDAVRIALARVPVVTLLLGAALAAIRIARLKARTSGRGARDWAKVLSAPDADPKQIALSQESNRTKARQSLSLADGHFIADLAMVTSVCAAANYVEIRLATKVILTRVTMAELEDRLSPLGFRRIHRSTIVNWDCVESVVPQRTKLVVSLKSGERFPVGPSYREQVVPS